MQTFDALVYREVNIVAKFLALMFLAKGVMTAVKKLKSFF